MGLDILSHFAGYLYFYLSTELQYFLHHWSFQAASLLVFPVVSKNRVGVTLLFTLHARTCHLNIVTVSLLSFIANIPGAFVSVL